MIKVAGDGRWVGWAWVSCASLLAIGLGLALGRNLSSLGVMRAALAPAADRPRETCVAEVPLVAGGRTLALTLPLPPDYVLAAKSAALRGCADEQLAWLAAGNAHWPAEVLLAWQYGLAQEAAGDHAGAIKTWQAAPTVARVFLWAADAALARRDPDGALTALTTATQVDPNFTEAFHRLGQHLAYTLGRQEEALAAYYRARELGEPDPYLSVEIAHALAQLGRFAEARAELDAHGSTNALANAIRGQSYLVEDNAPEAVAFLELAVQQSPQDPWYHWLLGIAYARLNRPADAMAAWRASVDVRPGFSPGEAALACGSNTLIPEQCLPSWARSTG